MKKFFLILLFISPAIFAQQNKTETALPTPTASTMTSTPSLPGINSAQQTDSVSAQKDHFNQILNSLTQNLDNPLFIHRWFQNYSISGLINLQNNYESHQDFTSNQHDRVDISAVKLNLDANPTPWVSGHVGFFYANDSQYYEQGYHNRGGVKIDDAYLTLANSERTPFFARVGEQYLSFGRYYQFPLLTSLTQQLSETKEAAIQGGWIAKNGTYGSIAVFNGTHKQNHSGQQTNGVVSVNYENMNHPVGFDVGADYILNMIDVGAIAQAVSGGYQKKVGGVSGHANVFAGPFDFAFQYVTAVREFDAQDFSYQEGSGALRGAKPKAGSVKAGYTFTLWDCSNKINTGYQWSREAYNINEDTLQLPYNRWFGSYSIHLKQPILLGVLIARDQDYSASHGGTNRVNYIGLGRVSVLF